MFEKIKKNRLQEFKKRHFVRVIGYVRRKCTMHFGYSTPPYVFETELPPDAMMFISRSYVRKNSYGIFYDYKKFKKHFGRYDFETQLCYAALFIAHEMRHYYQMRQLDSKTPREKDWLLERWREDEKNLTREDGTNLEYQKTPLEIDAHLYSYWFVAENFDRLVSFNDIDKRFIDELEKYHIELFGETDEWLFPKDELSAPNPNEK